MPRNAKYITSLSQETCLSRSPTHRQLCWSLPRLWFKSWTGIDSYFIYFGLPKIRIEEMNDKIHTQTMPRPPKGSPPGICCFCAKQISSLCHFFILVPCSWARTLPSFALSKRHIADISKTRCWPAKIDGRSWIGDEHSASAIVFSCLLHIFSPFQFQSFSDCPRLCH